MIEQKCKKLEFFVLRWLIFAGPVTYGNLVGQIDCTFLVRESLTICIKFIISDKCLTNFKLLFWATYT